MMFHMEVMEIPWQGRNYGWPILGLMLVLLWNLICTPVVDYCEAKCVSCHIEDNG